MDDMELIEEKNANTGRSNVCRVLSVWSDVLHRAAKTHLEKDQSVALDSMARE